MSQDFLAELQKEAEKQSELQKKRILPSQLDGITSFIGRYPWQVLLVASGITTLIWHSIG